MFYEYKYIDKDTYDIIEKPNVFAVDSRTSDIISILNKKGYYTNICDISCVEKVEVFINLLNKIFENGPIDDRIDKEILEYILNHGSGSIFIVSDEFADVEEPVGFYKFKNGLAYDVKPIKFIGDQMYVKTKDELFGEIMEILNILKKWSNSLPKLNRI